MQVLQQRIHDFTYSNLTETVDKWSDETTYDEGSEARIGAYIYKSVISDNLGNNPLENIGKKWVKSGVSNRFSMLDLRSNTKSILDDANIVVEFNQNNIDTLAIGNYEASTILIEILDDTNAVVWSYETPDTLNEDVYDWWDWTYEDYGYEVNRATMTKLGRLESKVRVTFKHIERTACGYLVGGIASDMGCTLYGVNFSFNSFATKEFDAFGTLNVVKRSVQDLIDFNTVVELNKKSLPRAKREIKELYDDVIVFIVDENEDSQHENMLTLGTIQDASIVLNDGVVYNIAWSVVEVI